MLDLASKFTACEMTRMLESVQLFKRNSATEKLAEFNWHYRLLDFYVAN